MDMDRSYIFCKALVSRGQITFPQWVLLFVVSADAYTESDSTLHGKTEIWPHETIGSRVILILQGGGE